MDTNILSNPPPSLEGAFPEYNDDEGAPKQE